ncbi:MAG: hypothetical protein WDZ59_05040 [Pirellulales bacterium]
MTRIFFTLAVFSLLLMAAAAVLGWGIGDLRALPSNPDTLRWATVHRLTGVAAALAVVFVHSIVVTYFVGTSRWCKEVVQTYRLDPALVRESAQIKRRAFPWSLGGMLLVVGIGALGAASDPATGRAGTENWTIVHFISAIGGLALIAWSYVASWNAIESNQRVIDRVVEAVRQIREARGLDVEPADKETAGTTS